MLTIKPDKHILKNISKYLRKEGRVSFQLHQLLELLRFSPLSNHSKHILQSQHSIHAVFKFYLLFHRLILENPSESNTVLELLSELRYSAKGKLQQMLEIKLIKPYRLYLQRRIQIWEQDECGQVSSAKQVRVYQLLNLINLGTSFCDVIYTFGRYYLCKFGCAIDFNIVLGVDINRVYEQMVQAVHRPAKRAILDEIQAAHQKMYVVFYNCYFHKYLKTYIPKWVNTDITAPQSRKKSMTPHKESTKSTLSRETTAKQRSLTVIKTNTKHKVQRTDNSMADSCLFLNDKVEEQVQQDPQRVEGRGGNRRQNMSESKWEQSQMERLKLLLSMQRVVGGR